MSKWVAGDVRVGSVHQLGFRPGHGHSEDTGTPAVTAGCTAERADSIIRGVHGTGTVSPSTDPLFVSLNQEGQFACDEISKHAAGVAARQAGEVEVKTAVRGHP